MSSGSRAEKNVDAEQNAIETNAHTYDDRWRMLSDVYHKFDLDGGGNVGANELLELGQARRRLGQKEGEWTVEDNMALIEAIGPDDRGVSAVCVCICVCVCLPAYRPACLSVDDCFVCR